MDKIKRRVIALAVFVALGYGGYQYFRPYAPSPQKLTLSQQEAMKKLNSEIKPYCVGRYMLDLPSSFVAYNDSAPLEKNLWAAVISRPEDIYKTYLVTKKMYHPGFVELLQAREKTLRESYTLRSENMPFLKKKWQLKNGLEGVIFERNKNEGVSDLMRILEGYLFTNGVVIKLEKLTLNDSAPRYETQRNGDPIHNFVQADVNQMQSLMARISGRENDDIPTTPGTCITHAFIASDPTEKDREDISVGLESQRLEHIRIILSTDNFTREDDTVLDRAGEIKSNLYRGRVERKGAFIVNGLQAQELLATGLQAYQDESRYSFNMFINEMTASYKTPNFILTLENDSMPPTSYSKEEIIAFWDTLSRSVRVRPGAF